MPKMGESIMEATILKWHKQAGDPVRVLNELTGWALERGVELAGLEVRKPNLEDVYLELTSATEAEEVGS